MAFAIIETGGKQYRVSNGDAIKIEKLPDVKEGAAVVFDKILLTDDGAKTVVGAPYISGVSVNGEVIEEGRNKKIEVVKYKAKSRYFKLRGHRQPFMKVKITGGF
ncbi:MAG: 50S ribosomal protein L21 [Parcubacteria group bacterium Gr01-1014_17]|nr:MAG: 50S ribosomal protein L21 [Parcubacteria group bacterium Gr01-1014_17]